MPVNLGQSKERPEVIVIGAGVAGFSAALELAERGYQVKLLEQYTLGSGASGRNPGRMGHGFHYANIETAKMYLRASIQVQRKYPNYLVGKNLPEDNPLRHGRYFIMKNSDYPASVILDTYKEIKKEYQRLIEEDPANEVFGPVKNFYRILKPHEYENDVNMENVEVGVETAEHLFNWKDFSADIKEKILENPNIKLYENTEVVKLERGDIDESRFIIHAKRKAESGEEVEETIHTDFIVNSTWQNIEKLNDQLNLTMAPESRTNRLKCLLVVKLPESLHNSNSMFFCMGQHGMYSNLGNGYGMITYAKVTNMGTFHGLDLDERTTLLLNGGTTKEEKDEIAKEKDRIAKQMLEGITTYIPAMKDAEIVDVKFGIVQTEGKLTLEDLQNPSSSFHKRNYYGVREEQIGFISNPAVKLFYFAQNGKLVADLVDAQWEATLKINQYMKTMIEDGERSNCPFSKDLRKGILASIERCSSSTFEMELNTEEKDEAVKKKRPISETIKKKKELQKAITSHTLFEHEKPEQNVISKPHSHQPGVK